MKIWYENRKKGKPKPYLDIRVLGDSRLCICAVDSDGQKLCVISNSMGYESGAKKS